MTHRERARQAQFELLLSYMEQHGDIQSVSKGIERDIRWVELTDMLNNKSLGEPKPIEKWRKCWSDLKNNTKRKEMRIKRKICRVDLSKLEKRVLKLLESQKNSKQKSTELGNENTIVIKSETEQEEDQVTPSPCDLFEDQSEIAGNRNSSTSPSNSGSSDEESPTPGKRTFENNIKEIADKYLEFEREREKLAHDREMARIKQNDQLIMIFGKIVNVLETLTPNIQKYLDPSTNNNR